MLKYIICAAFLAAAAAPAASAQDNERMNTVVVTASYRDMDNRQAAPNIYQRVRADFVHVGLTVTSGSRDTKERQAELDEMFKRLKAKVEQTDGYALSGGEAGASTAPIETVLFSDIYLNYGDRGSFTLVLSIDTRDGETFDQLFARSERFVDAIPLQGRAEAFLDDEQFLGIRRTDQHRDALLSDIQGEVNKLRRMFRPGTITMTGLDSRVVTQPSGPLELEIFIPYKMTLEVGPS